MYQLIGQRARGFQKKRKHLILLFRTCKKLLRLAVTLHATFHEGDNLSSPPRRPSPSTTERLSRIRPSAKTLKPISTSHPSSVIPLGERSMRPSPRLESLVPTNTVSSVLCLISVHRHPNILDGDVSGTLGDRVRFLEGDALNGPLTIHRP